jgi:hypothetical protein
VIQPNDTDVTTTHSLDHSTPSSTQISNPTRIYAELTWKGGLVTTLPPTYMSECKRSLSSLNDLSRTITSAEHCRYSSASSNRATILHDSKSEGHKIDDVRLPFAKTDGRGIFTVDVQRLGLPGQIENKSIEGSSHVWRGDNDAFGKR